MKQDRFLLGILVGIGVLVIVALGLFFTRQDTQEYVSDDTPEGVVHNYSLAVYREDYEKAYGYLEDAKNKPTFSEFQTPFFNHYVDPRNVGLEIGESKIAGEEGPLSLCTLSITLLTHFPVVTGVLKLPILNAKTDGGKYCKCPIVFGLTTGTSQPLNRLSKNRPGKIFPVFYMDIPFIEEMFLEPARF